MKDVILQKAAEFFPEVKSIRHHIHANPELSFEEHNTSAFVISKLQSFGITDIRHISDTGVVALVTGKNPSSKCIALRADMDALPIQEENTVAYRSRNDGVMHACGHDVHTSCLLGAAKILQELRDSWEGTVKLIFQPGEEKHPGGASILIEKGVLTNPAPSAILALHVYPNLPAGTIGYRAGQYMASADEIYITIHGKGGHAAQPHNTVDPIAVAAQLIVSLQQLVSRKANPLSPSVLTFGSIHGGFATNVIPDKVELLGTFRAMDEQWRAEAHRLIREITHHTCAAYGATADIDIPPGYPSLFNDPGLTADFKNWAEDYVGADHVRHLDMRMGAEDFSFYTHHAPGCFFRIGTSRNGTEYTLPVHTSRFNIEEEAMQVGMGMMAWAAVNALKR